MSPCACVWRMSLCFEKSGHSARICEDVKKSAPQSQGDGGIPGVGSLGDRLQNIRLSARDSVQVRPRKWGGYVKLGVLEGSSDFHASRKILLASVLSQLRVVLM
jgi:hypothetical protein